MRGCAGGGCLLFGVGVRRFRLGGLWVLSLGLCRGGSRFLAFQKPRGWLDGCGCCMFLRRAFGGMDGGGLLGPSLRIGICV